METHSPHKKGGTAALPSFCPMSVCGQTAGWIKMLLGMEVGLGPGDIVLDGDPAPPTKVRGHSIPQLWPNGCQSQLLLSSCWFLPWLTLMFCLSSLFNNLLTNKCFQFYVLPCLWPQSLKRGYMWTFEFGTLPQSLHIWIKLSVPVSDSH